MKKILISIMTMAVVLGMIGAGAFAYFSDTESSTGNSLTAGTLNLGPGSDFVASGSTLEQGAAVVTAGGDGTNGNVVWTKLLPADDGWITWSLKNSGDIDGFVDLEGVAVSQAENNDPATNEAENDDDADTTDATGGGELDNDMNVVLFWDTDGDHTVDGGETTMYNGTLSGLVGGIANSTNYALAAGVETFVSLTWAIPGATNNEIMGDSTGLDVSFELAQTAAQ